MDKEYDILVVDDALENLKVLFYILSDYKYHVRAVQSGDAAIKAINSKMPDLLLLDINLPDMTGFEVIPKILMKGVPVIFISGNTDYQSKRRAFELGGVDYITKPFNDFEVLSRIKTHLSIKHLREQLEEKNRDLESLVIHKMEELYEAQLSTIVAISKLAESRDDDTGKHIERVSIYSRNLAELLLENKNSAYRVDKNFCRNIYFSGSMHDIGKIAIPDNILLKPGKLTKEEFEIMKTHSHIGAENLKTVWEAYPNNSFIKMGVEIAQSHHEHWDGKGYPEGLSRYQIPLSARIVALVDVFDAICSKRPYKEALPREFAIEYIKENSGLHFDPYLVELFLTNQEKFFIEET